MSSIQGPSKKSDPQKKSVSDQSISAEERIQATIRSPQYQKDWTTYDANVTEYFSQLPDHLHPRKGDVIKERPEENPVAKKWSLPFPQYPSVPTHQAFSHYYNGESQCSCELLTEWAPIYLDIRVYLESPLTDIRKHVMKLVNNYRELSGIKNRTPRARKGVDIWKVYDMKIRDKKPLIEIARAWWPNETIRNSIGDPKTKNKYEQISRAVQRATELVKMVEEEAGKNKIPLKPHRNLYKKYS